jgi:hypothetical protein
MKISTRIGETLQHGFSPLDELEHYFLNYNEDEWSYGGQSDGRFVIYGVEGTENADPFHDRVDLTLCIFDHPEFGMYLYHSRSGGGRPVNFFSMGDMSRLTEMTESQRAVRDRKP